ncbi:FtsX-like permease family protein [Bifidobacterium sp. 82T24]|uniref:FtsX-like permease family protein n=1 Tax=Bifidobacterium pluvialisilvae TaxID=2834436 RepID=UPI001C55DDD3|nr:FtsX-like permease family protein [Bifidobacterium pluvialisilvae]MBW3087579.1 FtsX-like permease family protein [Bifidobacterium pluvialisilvae]
MTKALLLDFWREIRHSANRFFSILCIVAIGVGFFAGLKSSAPDMRHTMDDYFDSGNVEDIDVLSSLGLTGKDIDAIRGADGVEAVQPGYFTDALAKENGSQLVFRIHSLPEGTDPNRVTVVAGRMPRTANEVVIEDSANYGKSLKIGDRITFESGTDKKITDGTLTGDTFTIVGRAITPYYLTVEKGTSRISGKSLNLFAYVPASAFSVKDENGNPMYTQASVTVKGAKGLNAFGKDYERLVDKAKDSLTNIGSDRARERGSELRSTALKKLQKAQAEYDKRKKEYDKQIADAEDKLSDANAQLASGGAKLDGEKENYQLRKQNGEQQIQSGQQQLDQAQQQIQEGEQKVQAGQQIYDSLKQQYDSMNEQVSQALAMMKWLQQATDTVSGNLKDFNGQLDKVPQSQRAQYQSMLDSYQTFLDQLSSQKESLDKMVSQVETLQQTISDAFDSADTQLQNGKDQLAAAKRQYNQGVAQLEAAKRKLNEADGEAKRQFDAAQSKLDKGKKDYAKNKADFESKKQDGAARLDDAKAKLIGAKYEIDNIDNPHWYVLDRSTNAGFLSYRNTVDRVDALAQVIPVFFILVAVLVCMTTMARMVNEQRGVIGTYKALGYENNAIALKYVLYVVAASALGGVIGAAVGSWTFPESVYKAWSAMYRQPPLEHGFHPGIMASSFAVTVIAMALVSYLTCRKELNSQAATLMRPKAPRVGKRILLERIPVIWKHLNFSQKVTMRNLFRYKRRLIMTVVGIMGCTGLLVAGLGMNDTIGSVVSKQYDKVFAYDMSVTLDPTADKAETDAVYHTLDIADSVSSYTQAGVGSATISEGGTSETLALYAANTPDSFTDYIRLDDPSNGRPIALDDSGIVLTEKLARNLGVTAGDTVSVRNEGGMTKRIPVTGVTENYVFHYAYMSQKAYAKYFLKDMDTNTLLVKLHDNVSARQEDSLQRVLQSVPSVTSVTSYTKVADDFRNQIKAMNSIVLLIIVCAALLAFVVLYNLTNINVSERIREIATIKVLGFKRGEVAMYIYRENFLLTLIGAVFGLLIGSALHRVIMQAIEQKDITFGYVISPWSYIWSFLLTALFSIIVMLAMYPKLIRIPMVESLKSVE